MTLTHHKADEPSPHLERLALIRRLKAEAIRSATRHGHSMGSWQPYFTFATSGFEATCEDCGCYVRVNPDPAPNEVDISGDVFGTSCKHTE